MVAGKAKVTADAKARRARAAADDAGAARARKPNARAKDAPPARGDDDAAPRGTPRRARGRAVEHASQLNQAEPSNQRRASLHYLLDSTLFSSNNAHFLLK